MNTSLSRDAKAAEHPPTLTSMITMTQSVITGGVFNQTNVHMAKSPMELLQEQVAPAAFHNSAQRIDAPRCHPNTRVVVKEKAYRWITRKDTGSMNASILWLNGPAGGGKSAIAQSLAEQCDEEKLLLASFFFSRSDPLRNHPKHLVSTIVYQVYQLVPPSAQHLILRATQDDPLIWSRDLFTQFRTLVGGPLAHLIHSGFFQDAQAPRVIIIDGLDECIDRLSQQKILDLIFKALYDWHLPFLFLVASRPEPEIKAVFESPKSMATLFTIPLSGDYLPDADIELFLRDKLKECYAIHPFRHYIPLDWPTNIAIKTLVKKSSGQFIYAAVVVKYVTSIRHYPHRRLESILNLRPMSDLPFADLDAVYHQILSSVDNLPVVQRIISFRLVFQEFTEEEIEIILEMEDGGLRLVISDITSLMSSNGGSLNFVHASFEDWLVDIARSKNYHVDRAKTFCDHVKTLISIVMTRPEDGRYELSATILRCLPRWLASVDFDSDITQFAISSFSISALYDRLRQSPEYRNWLVWIWNQSSLPVILHALDVSKYPHAALLRQHLLRDFDESLFRYLDLYPKTARFNFNVALISLVQEPYLIPRGAFSRTLRLDCDNGDKFDNNDILSFRALREKTLHMISDYLRAPSRSHSHFVGSGIYSEAAIFCLEYLCDHTSPAQAKMPRMTQRQRGVRRMYPWKWNHRPFSEEIKGSDVTPWMWLKWPWETKTILKRNWRGIVYAHLPLGEWTTSTDNSPIGYYRARAEKYWLALHYLSLFLPLAGRSDVLVEMCTTKVFASKSQDFPRKSRRARTAMRVYLERWGYPLC